MLETITQEAFDKFYPKYLQEKEGIEKQLEACSGCMSVSNLPAYLEQPVTFSRKLNTLWASGDVQLKEDLQKLVFPEGTSYDRKKREFRTEKVNFPIST